MSCGCLQPLTQLPLIPGTTSGAVMAPCENPNTIRVDLIWPLYCPVAALECGHWGNMLIPTWGDNDVHTFSETSVSVGTRGSPALSGTLQIHVPQTGRKRGVRGGISWSYKEIHKRSAIGKSNLLAKKDLVVGKWESVCTRQLMQRILTTIWNKHCEFAFKVKLGETAKNKKQCREIKKVLE